MCIFVIVLRNRAGAVLSAAAHEAQRDPRVEVEDPAGRLLRQGSSSNGVLRTVVVLFSCACIAVYIVGVWCVVSYLSSFQRS